VNNEKILEDFFRALRISLTTASSYSKDHPYFIKSVENFKEQLDNTLAVLDPLKIGITTTGIVVEGQNLTKGGFYDELAGQLHQRKLKSIEIRSGVTLQESIQFLSAISLPKKDVFKSGGINAILKSKPLAHFTVDELDYSAFLHVQGQECGDIWAYMLKEATQSNDSAKLDILADNFGPLLKRSSQKDIFEAEDVPSSIGEFLVSLKEKNKEKFDKCSRDVFLWILNNKKSLKEEELGRLKPVFKSLDQEDFSNLLWEGIVQEDNFDDLSLRFFSKISEQKDLRQIAEKFQNKTNQGLHLENNPNAVKRVQNLLTGSESDKLSPVYRNILESLMKGISSSGVGSFDQKSLRQNYRYIVLNLLAINADNDNLKSAAEILIKELSGIFEDNDFDFLKDLHSLLTKRKNEAIAACIELEKQLSMSIENAVLNQTLLVGQEFLLDMILISAQGADAYLNKIFIAEKADQQILSLFFRLFPGRADIFCRRLEKKLQDMDYIFGLVDSLSQLQGFSVLPVMEYIYSSANELIKCETLKGMRKFKEIDADFLIRQLGTDSVSLRKNLLSVLMKDTQGINTALDLLFRISSPWGSKNKLFIENIQIVFDLRIPEAVERVRDLSARKFFWNRGLRNKAKQVLGEWNER